MNIVIYLFSFISVKFEFLYGPYRDTLTIKLCETMKILSISCKFIKFMEFIKDELHIILKLMEFTLQYHNYLN
jgi:hypothetical protein